MKSLVDRVASFDSMLRDGESDHGRFVSVCSRITSRGSASEGLPAVSARLADRVARTSALLGRLEQETPELTRGPLARDRQVWISKGAEAPDARLLSRRLFADIADAAEIRASTKPFQLGLFSSTSLLDYTRPHGIRHMFGAYDLARDRLYGHVKARKGRTQFLEFCRYLRTLYPPEVRIALVLDNFSPHLSTRADSRAGDWALANNAELAYVPFYASWLNRIEAQFTALRYFALDGTDRDPHSPAEHDPPLHRLAQPQRPRQDTPKDRRQGKPCLTRH